MSRAQGILLEDTWCVGVWIWGLVGTLPYVCWWCVASLWPSLIGCHLWNVFFLGVQAAPWESTAIASFFSRCSSRRRPGRRGEPVPLHFPPHARVVCHLWEAGSLPRWTVSLSFLWMLVAVWPVKTLPKLVLDSRYLFLEIEVKNLRCMEKNLYSRNRTPRGWWHEKAKIAFTVSVCSVVYMILGLVLDLFITIPKLAVSQTFDKEPWCLWKSLKSSHVKKIVCCYTVSKLFQPVLILTWT